MQPAKLISSEFSYSSTKAFQNSDTLELLKNIQPSKTIFAKNRQVLHLKPLLEANIFYLSKGHVLALNNISKKTS
jgi:hypothetical protein